MKVSWKNQKKKQSKNLDDSIPVDLNIAIKYAIPCATSNALVELSWKSSGVIKYKFATEIMYLLILRC